ncbi:hypothetical protein, partial [Serinicoccus sp. CNJ-927]|uniref:hypothetical protein n=1 Tax=Serinicoccus sp. CNJ-927 TaxID=1904970 RepID=UPI0013014362
AARSDDHPALRQDLHTRRDLLNRAFYAALAHRGPGAFLTDADDHPGTGEHGGPLSGWMWVTRTKTGRRRNGADPTTPTPEAVLGEEKSTEAAPRRRTADPDPTGWRTPPDDEPPF